MKTETDIDRFCHEHGVVISAISAQSSRPEKGRDSAWDKKAIHFRVTLSLGDKEIWTGFYSVGSGRPKMWARDGCKLPEHARKSMKETRRVVPMYDTQARNAYYHLDHKSLTVGREVTLHDEKQWDIVRARFEALGVISAGDVLGSLVMDSRGSDQDFADWAGDLGYSEDSISAKEIWEACNDIRRALQATFTPDQLETLYEMEI